MEEGTPSSLDMVSSPLCGCPKCMDEFEYHECQMSVPVYDTAYLVKYKPYSSTQLPRKNSPVCQCHLKVDGIYYSTITEVGYVNGKTHRCRQHSHACSHLHHRERFWRRNGFPFFNLPPEVRLIVLELLLVKGNVALMPNTELTWRFPHWKHEQPEWGLLEAVSRQMQAEASEIFYSRKNTFFLPSLRARDTTLNTFDHLFRVDVKRIDCEPNMNNFQMSHAGNYRFVRETHPFEIQLVPFEDWSRDAIHLAIHEALHDTEFGDWNRLQYLCLSSSALDVLVIKITDFDLPVVSQRPSPSFTFGLLHKTQENKQPKRFELRHLSEEEKDLLWVKLEAHEMRPEDRAFPIHQPGCTCPGDESRQGDCEGIQLLLSKEKIDIAAEGSTDK